MKMYIAKRDGILGFITLMTLIAVLFLVTPNIAMGAVPPPGIAIDGKVVTFAVPPAIIDGRTYVPMRGIFEKLGTTVSWQADSGKITAINATKTVVLKLNSEVASVDGVTVQMDAPPRLIGNSTMVPLRFVAQALGASVNWNSSIRLVTITSAGHADVPVIVQYSGTVDTRSDSGRTALMEAALSGSNETVKKLLAMGANVNLQDNLGNSPLSDASRKGNKDTVQLLLNAGANTELMLNDGMTSIILAANGGYAETVKVLLSAGANVNAKADNGCTALILGAGLSETKGPAVMVSILLAAGADTSASTNKIINTKLNVPGMTALMHASVSGHTEAVKLMLNAGASVDTRADNGRTALIFAASKGKNQTAITLLGAGADVNRRDDGGYTALMVASYGGFTETVKTLLASGADVNYKTYSVGKTALMLASEKGHKTVVELLKAAGAR